MNHFKFTEWGAAGRAVLRRDGDGCGEKMGQRRLRSHQNAADERRIGAQSVSRIEKNAVGKELFLCHPDCTFSTTSQMQPGPRIKG